MRFHTLFVVSLLTAFLSACGGGGGNPGTSGTGGSSGGTSPTATTINTVIAVKLTDLAGTTVQSVPPSGGQLVATLTTSAGVPLANQLVAIPSTIVVADDYVTFPSGKSASTDGSGIAKIKINRLSLSKFGSTFLTVAFNGDNTCSVVSASCPTAVNYASYSSEQFTLRLDPPAFQMELRDANNAVTTSIGASGLTTLRAVLRFADGTPVTQKRVDVVGDFAKVAFPNGASQLTDASGVALIKVTRASLNVNGAGSLDASATISGASPSGIQDNTVIAGKLDYQVGEANIALASLNLGTGSLAAYGNRPISVKATINGVAATTTPVQVTFSASCGTIAPATVSTDASGTASTTYSASLATCAGANVTLTASSVGATSVIGTIPVAASIATNVQFMSTVPQLIYLKDSVGTTQAQVKFKVVDSSGNPLQNKKLRVSLSNTATGVSLDTVGNNSPVTFTTDNAGLISAAVFSGTVPTSLNVRATLLDVNDVATNVYSDSNLLTVASGRPAQRSLSLALGKMSLEGANYDGDTTTVTLSMADRQGNPVPPGTQVNFVTEAGVLLPAVCFVPPVTPETATSAAIPVSACTVNIRTSGTRTASGRVSILAYVAGEEDFVDINGNNFYDSGDTFTDLGRAFRDDNAQAAAGKNGTYDAGEFQVPREGTVACAAGAGCKGDDVWGVADVRAQAIIVFATGTANIVGQVVGTSFTFTVSDLNGNSMPTGTSVKTSGLNDTCGPNGKLSLTETIANTIFPTQIGYLLSNALGGACTVGNGAVVIVTTPLGTVTRATFIP